MDLYEYIAVRLELWYRNFFHLHRVVSFEHHSLHRARQSGRAVRSHAVSDVSVA